LTEFGALLDRDSINPPYHVIGWNYLIEMEFVEELPLTRCQPTHHALPPKLIASAPPNHASRPPSIESCNTIRGKADTTRTGRYVG
jgi:hypothetical protein